MKRSILVVAAACAFVATSAGCDSAMLQQLLGGLKNQLPGCGQGLFGPGSPLASSSLLASGSTQATSSASASGSAPASGSQQPGCNPPGGGSDGAPSPSPVPTGH